MKMKTLNKNTIKLDKFVITTRNLRKVRKYKKQSGKIQRCSENSMRFNKDQKEIHIVYLE